MSVENNAPNKPISSKMLATILKSCFLNTIESIYRNNGNGIRATGK